LRQPPKGTADGAGRFFAKKFIFYLNRAALFFDLQVNTNFEDAPARLTPPPFPRA